MDIERTLHDKRQEVNRIAQRHGAFNVRVFGSMARGDAGPESDIDLLIDVGPHTSSWFPAGLIMDLESLLGRKVEIVTERALDPYIREQVLHEAVAL
jgi:predicted nucleotidyltransferase